MEIALISVYAICMLFILIFSLVQLHLTFVYKKAKKTKRDIPKNPKKIMEYPLVTIQLPIFNEKYVAERLLDFVAEIEWPKDSIEFQVLDDSTDETSSIIQRKLSETKFDGLDILHLRRTKRQGFKAGALRIGLQVSKGEYVAIFDADFMPKKTFLAETIGEFEDPKIGMVQTKWKHMNKDFSLLTKLQDFGLNGHFRIEQTGRNEVGSFINFNGTGGIWRKSCILESGGWQADTLTEDLDLSYRAQMKGWKFKYLEDVTSPAELPINMSAVKSQQFRWTKGGAETAKKNLGKVLKANLSLTNKIHAFFHLTNSANFLLLFIASFISIPLLYIKFNNPEFKFYFDLGSVFIIGFLAISYFYWTANKAESKEDSKFKYYPLYIAFSMGFTLNNSLAVIEGLIGKKTPFVRTPKLNFVSINNSWKENNYMVSKLTWVTVAEGLLSIYFFAGIVFGLAIGDYGLILFHLLLSVGYAGIFYLSIKH